MDKSILTELFKKHEELKNKYIYVNLDDVNFVTFAGIKLHPDMKFSYVSDDELILYHSVAHNAYVVDKDNFTNLKAIHTKLEKEMKKRGLEHFYLDKLDK